MTNDFFIFLGFLNMIKFLLMLFIIKLYARNNIFKVPNLHFHNRETTSFGLLRLHKLFLLINASVAAKFQKYTQNNSNAKQ